MTNTNMDNNNIRITGTKWYVDVEYGESAARFDGEMCIDGFYATVSSISWTKHPGEVKADDLSELVRAVMQYNKKNAFKLYFCNDDGSKYSPS